MNINNFIEYIAQNGLIILFFIVFLEYLNLPGLPAGIIMPAAGVLVANGEFGFFNAVIVSVIAGALGSSLLYGIGRFGGSKLINVYIKKFPKQQSCISRIIDRIKARGYYGVFISKLIPVARTLISIPAGAFKFNFLKFSLSSTLGIIVWNTIFIGAGYFLGEGILYL